MATISERLEEARLAYHRLVTGGQPVEVRDASGESIRYTVANASRLKIYIKELEAELAGTKTRARRPLRPVWG